MSRAPILRLTDVHKAYRLGHKSVDALRGLSLEIERPGFYAIMGPSGSGKSTLLHLLAALDRPDTGTIEVAGARLDELSERELTRFRRRRIGIVFQQFNLIATLTALDNVALPALLDGMPTAERKRRSRELLERFGLGDRLGHRPDALSGGEQQRVAIARSLMFEPEILFADEPTGNLDSRTSEEIWQLMTHLGRDQGITVLMVTHEPAGAVHADRVFILRDGRIDGSFDVDGLHPTELAARTQ